MKKLFLKYKEIIMYLIMGGLTTIVSWGTYTLFARGLPIHNQDLLVLTANALSWLFAMTFAYVSNKIWVFESKSWERHFLLKEFGMFVSARLLTGIFEVAAVPALVWMGCNQTVFGTPGMLSKIIVSIIVVILNYVLSKILIFRKQEEK